MNLSRADTSLVGRWWWTVDRWTIAAFAVLIGFGVLLAMAASPAVATRIGLDNLHFVKRQLIVVPPALALMFAMSLLSPVAVRRLAVILCLMFIGLLALTFVAGTEIKGARRWLSVAGFSLQPSEFIKPCFAVVAAWMFAEKRKDPRVPGNAIAMALYAAIMALLLLQPDLGMAVVVSAIFFTQFFLAGLPMVLVVLFMVLGMVGLVGAYFTFSHVASRIDRFLDPASGDSYQVDRSLGAFMNGGLFGVGPGEGTVKSSIPDAHADFVFAVVGEEFGLIACLIVVSLFGFVVLRGFGRVLQESNLFVVLAATGLLVQFGLQAIINMGSSLHLIPTKGMTLPFISYGGSSLLAIALGMGMLLALTRRRVRSADA